MAIPIVFLDRDGTVNVDSGYVCRRSEFQFAAGAVDGLRDLQAAGFPLAIISNQSGIARGFYSLSDVLDLHAHMTAELSALGIPIAAIAFCPHAPNDNCECRKPATGLADQVQSQLGFEIDFARSWTIGDKLSDLGFGRSLGTRTALVTSEYWDPSELRDHPDVIAVNLKEAAQHICSSMQLH